MADLQRNRKEPKPGIFNPRGYSCKGFEQSGMGTIEILIGLAVSILILTFAYYQKSTQMSAEKIQYMHQDLLVSKSKFQQLVSCSETLYPGGVSACDTNPDGLMLKGIRKNGSVYDLMDTIFTSGPYADSGLFEGKYIKAICRDRFIEIQVAYPSKSPSIPFAFDPNHKDPLDFENKRINPLMGANYFLCHKERISGSNETVDGGDLRFQVVSSNDFFKTGVHYSASGGGDQSIASTFTYTPANDTIKIHFQLMALLFRGTGNHCDVHLSYKRSGEPDPPVELIVSSNLGNESDLMVSGDYIDHLENLQVGSEYTFDLTLKNSGTLACDLWSYSLIFEELASS